MTLSVTDLRIPWGGLLVAQKHLDPHFTVIGCPGSGKTLTLRMLMKAAFAGPHPGGLRFRGLVYDPKRDMLPILQGMGIPKDRIAVLNPFDKRSVPWDMATDITDEGGARQLASIIAPVPKNSHEPYFTEAAQNLIWGVVRTFQKRAPGDWSLNDIVHGVTSPKRLRAILQLSEEGKDLTHTFLDQDDRTAGNIVSTLVTKVSYFRTIAALWERTPKDRRISLVKWMGSDPTDWKILVLGYDKAYSETLNPINNVIFRRMSELVVSRVDENPSDLTWVFLDEARLAGELDGLRDLLLAGRSKGARVVFGFQDVEGMRDVYNPLRANELMGLCGNVAFLRMNNPESQAWAARCIGSYEYWQQSTSRGDSWTDGKWTNTSSTTSSLTKREGMLEAEFRQFPLAGPMKGIPGVFMAPSFGGAWSTIVPVSFLDKHLMPLGETPGFLPRDGADQEPKSWMEEDELRLGLRQKEPPAVAWAHAIPNSDRQPLAAKETGHEPPVILPGAPRRRKLRLPRWMSGDGLV